MVRSAFGQPSWNPASRFLDEVPDELIEWERMEPSSSVRGTSAPSLAHVAARPSAKSPGNRQVVHLEPGDRVTHDTFGLGTVVAVEGAGDKSVAKVDFGADGEKRLLLRYAPVVKL
jgi:DNA helicase-2/ATP-dependent DNA helicase PcrA